MSKKKKSRKKKKKITKKSLVGRIAMATIGALAVYINIVGFGSFNRVIIGVLGLSIFGIGYLEVFGKLYTKLSELKKLGSSQYVSLILHSISLIVALIYAFWLYNIPVLSEVAHGIFLSSGLLIVFEAVRD